MSHAIEGRRRAFPVEDDPVPGAGTGAQAPLVPNTPRPVQGT